MSQALKQTNDVEFKAALYPIKSTPCIPNPLKRVPFHRTQQLQHRQELNGETDPVNAAMKRPG